MLGKQNREINRQIILASRPHGKPVAENFELKNSPLPKIQEGEILLRTIYLSLDPYMRGRMNDEESYADPVKIGDVMVGGTVCRVEKSLNSGYQKGDFVVGYSGWQDYAISKGEGLVKLPSEMSSFSHALGILGMPGFTAFMGLLDIGKPQEGETIVVAAATGPVGATVGQIAKIKGARAVGIAGGKEKCDHAVRVLGLDACIDHKSPDFEQKLKEACPDGIDIYFENVGGKVFDAVMPLLNTRARIPLCGLISQYNSTKLPDGPDRMSLLMGTLLKKRIKMQGFIIFDDYGKDFPFFTKQMTSWLAEGKIKYLEDMTEGLENAPKDLINLLDGKNFGKVVIKVGNEDL